MNFFNISYIPVAVISYIPIGAGVFSTLTTGASIVIPKRIIHLKLTEIALASFVGSFGFCFTSLILENHQIKPGKKVTLKIAAGALATFIPCFFKKTSFKNALVSSALLSLILYLWSSKGEKKQESEKTEED